MRDKAATLERHLEAHSGRDNLNRRYSGSEEERRQWHWPSRMPYPVDADNDGPAPAVPAPLCPRGGETGQSYGCKVAMIHMYIQRDTNV